MQWIELQNVECGECIVLGGKKREILMVDCGSSNTLIRDGGVNFTDYVKNGIMRRYRGMEHRAFLLTHCHRDHICGLWEILRLSPLYFDSFYLPVSPCDANGNRLLLEYALFVYVFLNRLTGYSRVNISELELFERVSRAAGVECVIPLRADDAFSFDGVTYEVLWPREENFPFSPLFSSAVEELNIRLSSPFLPDAAGEFLRLKAQFCAAYGECCASSPIAADALDRMTAVLERITALIPQLLFLPVAADAVEILNNPVTQNAYSDTLNAAGLIFQNLREREAGTNDILMTGDAPPEILEAVEDRLYDGYYVLKAPHHGTASAYSPLIADMGVSHILISNGEYRQGGQIAAEYAEHPAVKHCTNHNACPWYTERGSSCNRLACCYDHPAAPGLTIKCPIYWDSRKELGCRISVLTSSGSFGCLCDGKPLSQENFRCDGFINCPSLT